MHEKMIVEHKITFIRGATTASGNSINEIEDAVVELNRRCSGGIN